ncbi:hypothetical protein [Phytohabitans suffuscus]|uniref:Uncharacterized protein n=1 Tax=Phytohabitans suffuscus TaxID=624315 RepID=A0A6F8YF52_9ACTN|nr:hypothetical protein [Phytohabitans suffuscus]BCB84697.1 hypothetical protein Psuf_020100 [Phytohabitans suffuscus]
MVVSVAPPAGTPALSRPRALKAADALDNLLDRARQAVTPNGDVVTLLDRRVGAHPGGAMASLLVNAQSGEAALQAVTALVEHALRTVAPLRHWQLTEAHVELPSTPD